MKGRGLWMVIGCTKTVSDIGESLEPLKCVLLDSTAHIPGRQGSRHLCW